MVEAPDQMAWRHRCWGKTGVNQEWNSPGVVHHYWLHTRIVLWHQEVPSSPEERKVCLRATATSQDSILKQKSEEGNVASTLLTAFLKDVTITMSITVVSNMFTVALVRNPLAMAPFKLRNYVPSPLHPPLSPPPPTHVTPSLPPPLPSEPPPIILTL